MALPTVPAATALSSATNGDETQFFVSLDESAWVEVAELTDLGELPSGVQTLYETTHMKSGAFKEWKKNKRRDGDESDITFNYTINGTSETTLLAMEAATASLAYYILLKQGASTFYMTGRAIFSSLKRTNPMEEKRTATITAKWVTAAVTTVGP